jgi:hypothetical protein
MPSSLPDALVPLILRRQYCLSGSLSPEIPDATHTRIAGRHSLTTHKDLEVTHLVDQGRSLTLLGYLLDPDDPSATNAGILAGLLPRLGRCTDVIEPTHRLGGRWILVAHDGAETIVFHDAAGLRPVYYLAPRRGVDGELAQCAAEPGLLARQNGLELDPEALAYLRTRGDGDNEVYWMPGDTSPYAGIRALLPNHYLDLRTGQAVRYWPTAAIPALELSRAVAGSARVLRGQLEAASRRWPLSISLTAGWDSRLMLALCRGVAHDLFAFTLAYPGQASTYPDVQVPARLLPRLGLRHRVIRYPSRIDPDVKALARLNHGSIGSAYCADTQSLLEAHPPDRVCVTGDVAEIFKVHYRADGVADRDLVAGDLARLLKIGDGPFATAAMERWLQGARPSPLPLLDLLCWEQMAGRWQARIRFEYDTVHESWAPFNCRQLLVTMLGVAEEHRRAPGFGLLAALIQELWPEVMILPINPPEVPTLRRRLASAAARLGISRLVPAAAKDQVRRWLG